MTRQIGKIARTFHSVTIKATKLVSTKQDAQSRSEHVHDPAGCNHPVYSHVLFCSQLCSTVADLSLDMYTS